SITVPVGDRLVIELVNADPTNVHDLQVLGERSPRLGHGDTATLDVGVVGASTQGWCTIVGHRQLGMVLEVVVEGGQDVPVDGTDHATAGGTAYPGTATPLLDPDARV